MINISNKDAKRLSRIADSIDSVSNTRSTSYDGAFKDGCRVVSSVVALDDGRIFHFSRKDNDIFIEEATVGE